MTDSIQIRLLGTPSVSNARGVVTLGARAQALLYYRLRSSVAKWQSAGLAI